MKRYPIFAIAMAALLCSCGHEPTIEEQAAELIALANNVVGKPYSFAQQTILEQNFTAISKDTFVLADDNNEYIILSLQNDSVSVVEAQKEHSSQTDAKITLQNWSKTTYGQTLPKMSLWSAAIDSTSYIDGNIKPQIQSLFAMLVMAMRMGTLPIEIPEDAITAANEALQRNRANYLLDMQETTSVTIQEMGVYSSELETIQIDLSLEGLVNLAEALAKTYHVQAYTLQLSETNEKMRVAYTRIADSTIDLTNIGGLLEE